MATSIDRFPHCDQRILHAPLQGNLYVATLWSTGGSNWRLSYHPIGEAPASMGAASTSPRENAPKATSLLVIPLTEHASAALESLLTESRGGGSGSGYARETTRNIEREGARPVTASGDSTTFHPLSDELNWPRPSGIELPLAERMFARSELAHARIVMPTFLGGSWSLTTGTAAGWETLQLPDLSAKALSPVSKLKSLSAISSALTVIGPGLTSEQWKQELLRRSGECEYCDMHPEWQAIREAWGIAFTGCRPAPDGLPCPADAARPPGAGNDHRRWGGNKPTSASGDQAWPAETTASVMMYGDKGGREPWPLRERIRTRLRRPLDDWKKRRRGWRKENGWWRYP